MAFFTANEELLDRYGKITGLDASRDFLLEHPHLASNFSANYLTIQALNHAMELEVDIGS